MGAHGKLTKAFVDSASEAGFYWDTDMRGFGLRISGKTKTYIVQTRINGKDKRRTIGRHGVYTAEAARKRAREMLVQMSNGIDPKEDQRARREEGTTLQEAFDAYLARKKLAPRTEGDYKDYMRRYFADWKDWPMTRVTQDLVAKRHAELGKKHGPTQADVAFRFIRALFNFASGIYTRKNGDPLITVNPTKRLNALKQWFNSPARESYVREEQFQAWYKAVMQLSSDVPGNNTDTVRDYLLFLVFTGLRRSEAALIKWEHVDFSGRWVLLPRENTKNKTNFKFPLTTFTFELLKRREENNTSEYVFPSNGKSGHLVEPRYAMQKVTDATGIAFKPHDLRRTFATYASTVIENEWTVKRLMNHMTDQDITQRYIQGIERLRAPAQSVTDYMLSLIENGHAAIASAYK